MARNLVLYGVLRVVAPVLPIIPVAILHAFAAMAGFCMYYLAGEQRRGLSFNLGVALSLAPESPRVQNLVREAFQTNAQNWVDTVRLNSLQTALDGIVHVEGWENLARAAEAGCGVIMVTLHLGNFDLVGQALTRQYRLTVPVERMEPRQFFEFLLQRRRSQGINAIPLDQAPRQMISALQRGEMVGLAADGKVAGRAIDVTMFGRPARIPRAPVQLALRTGAPIVVGIGTRLPGGTYHGYITPAIIRPESAEPGTAEHEYAQNLAAILEGFIARFPGQWMAFTPLWHDEPAPRPLEIAV